MMCIQCDSIAWQPTHMEETALNILSMSCDSTLVQM